MTLKILHDWDEAIVEQMIRLKVLTMSDFHTGSQYGLLPPNAKTKTGHDVRQSSQQEQIWNSLCARLSKVGNVNTLIIAGDICEGKQIKCAGVTLSDADTDTMVNWAVQAIEEISNLVNPKHIIIVSGTPYHNTTAIGGDLDYQVANALSVKYDVYYGLPTANIKLGKLWWRISHKYPTTRNITPPMELFYKEYCTQAQIHKFRVPDVFTWGHAHQCIEPHRIISTAAYGMLLPALKLNDPYISQGFYSKPQADIGFILIHQNGEYIYGRFYRLF